MGRLALAMAAAISHRNVVLGRRLFAVRRVDSDALRRVGWASLEGSWTRLGHDMEIQLAARRRQKRRIVPIDRTLLAIGRDEHDFLLAFGS